MTALHLATTFRQYGVMIRLMLAGADMASQTGTSRHMHAYMPILYMHGT